MFKQSEPFVIGSTRCLIASVVLSICAALPSAEADTNSRQRVRAFAALPDWTGYWEQDAIDLGTGAEPPNGDEGFGASKLWQGHPSYNAEWEARYQAHPKAPLHAYCVGGFPAIMDSPYSQFELVVSPEQTLLIPIMLIATRQIFTDGRSHPGKDDSWATPMGDSIGHWEGETLVVDTVARKAGPIASRNDLSDQAHFVERIRLIGKDRLQDQMTIDDSVALAHPWLVTLTYRRMKGVDRLIPADCVENDRNPVVNGQFIIAPPESK
jgi:hypothetical protein